MKKIAIVTATRAEYGLLSPVINELRKRESESLKADLIVTGTHLSEKYGTTVQEIENDNIRIDRKISIPVSSDSELDIVLCCSLVIGMKRWLLRLRPVIQELLYSTFVVEIQLRVLWTNGYGMLSRRLAICIL